MFIFRPKITLAGNRVFPLASYLLRLWWNWQTRNLEVVVLTRRAGSSPANRTNFSIARILCKDLYFNTLQLLSVQSYLRFA